MDSSCVASSSNISISLNLFNWHLLWTYSTLPTLFPFVINPLI